MKINKKDFKHIAEYIKQTLDDRVKNRKDLDRAWKEIDRQVAMVPKTDHKQFLDPNGTPTGRRDPSKAWLPEIELPLQAEALETLVADSRSMMFPDSGPWFAAYAALTDDFLETADFTSIITGDQNEVPSQINQDNANKLAQGYINHLHRQYDFRGNIDIINAEAHSYGVGVGRARMVTKQVILETSRGIVRQDQKIPVLIPRSIKETYLDDRQHTLMHEGYMVGPLTIFRRIITMEDLKRFAGSNTDPNREDGGWIPREIANIEPDKHGNVELLEAEGDFVIPRKTTGSIYLPGVIFTVAVGGDPTVIRAQHRKFPFNSVLEFPYHKERVGSPYASSPLRKGMPIQAAAVEALMRLVEVSALNSRPPVGYDRSDSWFAQQGGPVIEPGAMWGTISDINVHNIGDVSALFQVYLGFLNQYADATGMHRARLGAQTVSHTTAFAKNAELQRGAVRTVDYVRTALQGPLTQWLGMCYEMGRANFRKNQTFYIDSYRGFVTLPDKSLLPDLVVFEAHGSGGPAEEQALKQQKLAALQQALQMDQMNMQIRGPQAQVLNLAQLIEDTLIDGGWTDVDPFIQSPQTEGGAPGVAPDLNDINTA